MSIISERWKLLRTCTLTLNTNSGHDYSHIKRIVHICSVNCSSCPCSQYVKISFQLFDCTHGWVSNQRVSFGFWCFHYKPGYFVISPLSINRVLYIKALPHPFLPEQSVFPNREIITSSLILHNLIEIKQHGSSKQLLQCRSRCGCWNW